MVQNQQQNGTGSLGVRRLFRDYFWPDFRLSGGGLGVGWTTENGREKKREREKRLQWDKEARHIEEGGRSLRNQTVLKL